MTLHLGIGSDGALGAPFSLNAKRPRFTFCVSSITVKCCGAAFEFVAEI